MHARQRLGKRLGEGAFVLGMPKREQQADRHGLDLEEPDRVRGAARLIRRQRDQRSVGAAALADLDHALVGNHRCGVRRRQPVQVRAVLAA